MSLMALLFGFVSCSNDDNDDATETKDSKTSVSFDNIEALDISDAKALYIGTGTTGSNRSARDAASESIQKLLKITDSDKTEEVAYLDKDGKPIDTMIVPKKICKAGDKFMYVELEAGYYSKGVYIGADWAFYLVNNETGAVFDLKNIGVPDDSTYNFKNDSMFITDKVNGLYYLSGERVIRLSNTDTDYLTSSVYSPSSDSPEYFTVDKDGFMLYTGRGDSGFYTRVKKPTGSLVPMTYTYAFWTGLDGYMYYCEYDSSDEVSIKKIDTTNYEVNITDYATNLLLDFYLEYPYDAYKLTLKNKMYFIRGTSILEVHNESNTPRVVTLTEINAASVSHVVATENYYYLAGTDTAGKGFLVKVDPTNDTCTNLLSEDYVMYTFTASEEDGIVFNAMRMSDGKKIIGKVGINGGAVTIIDEESDAQITYLERIN